MSLKNLLLIQMRFNHLCVVSKAEFHANPGGKSHPSSDNRHKITEVDARAKYWRQTPVWTLEVEVLVGRKPKQPSCRTKWRGYLARWIGGLSTDFPWWQILSGRQPLPGYLKDWDFGNGFLFWPTDLLWIIKLSFNKWEKKALMI